MKKFRGTVLLILLVAGTQLAQAEEKKGPAKAPTKDKVVEKMKANATAEIEKLVEAYVTAFNAQNAKALAAQWTVDAVYRSQLTGEIIEGREALEAEFAAQFKELKSAKLEVTTQSIEFLSPSVAVEEGTATVVLPKSKPEKSSYTVIYVKRDGKWLIDRVSEKQEVAADESHYEKLKDLNWMVGTWIDQDKNFTIKTECKWIGNRNYLLRTFTATSDGESVDLSGMQFIGWDANKEQIRSWVFDSNGGYSEGVWTKKKDRWTVKTKATLAGGQIAASTSVLKPIDENSFTWQKVNRFIDGEILPNIDEVLIVREMVLSQSSK